MSINKPQTFETTKWSVVLRAIESDSPDAARAMSELCETYWYPLYCYVRRRGYSATEAQDLTQSFFSRFLERPPSGRLDAKRGKFRSFMLASVRHFLADTLDHRLAKKRGGSVTHIPLDLLSGENRYLREPYHNITPERIYEKSWAMTILNLVWTRLEDEYRGKKREDTLANMKLYLVSGSTPPPYRDVAKKLQMTEGSVKVAVYRLRRRFREILCETVAETLTEPSQVDDELRYLLEALSDSP